MARYLCRALDDVGWEPTLFTGSMGPFTDASNAEHFFAGIACESLDYTPAVWNWRRGEDPMVAAVPMHASFEDKPGVPDRCFFDLDDAAFDRQVASWARLLASHVGAPPSVLHLHHLTPLHEAAAAVWPGVPLLSHLHGTELKMLASVQDGSTPTSPERWTDHWVERMRRWAVDSDRLVVVSEQDARLARQLLPVDAARVSAVPNAVDTAVFSSFGTRGPTERLASWRHWLVDEPRGWRPGQQAGSVRYDEGDLSPFTDADGQPVTVVLFAGRFMRAKRLQLLIEAHHNLRSTTKHRSVLVIAGGFVGEWEGEHPYDTMQRLAAIDVFFLGWRDHDELAAILGCSDVFAAPSVDEAFGLVYLEAMAVGIPPIATDTGGPVSFINVDHDHPTGWLIAPDDIRALTAALTEAVADPVGRVERGCHAACFVRDHYSWATTASAFARLYSEATDEISR